MNCLNITRICNSIFVNLTKVEYNECWFTSLNSKCISLVLYLALLFCIGIALDGLESYLYQRKKQLVANNSETFVVWVQGPSKYWWYTPFKCTLKHVISLQERKQNFNPRPTDLFLYVRNYQGEGGYLCHAKCIKH